MSFPERNNRSDAEYIGQRVVARATLRKISHIIQTWEDEAKQDKLIVKTVLMAFLCVVFLLAGLSLFVDIFHFHLKFLLLTGLVIVGICGVIVLALWCKRSK